VTADKKIQIIEEAYHAFISLSISNHGMKKPVNCVTQLLLLGEYLVDVMNIVCPMVRCRAIIDTTQMIHALPI
jgi:hypothetical protein